MTDKKLLRCDNCNQETEHERLTKEEIDALVAKKNSLESRAKELLATVILQSHTSTYKFSDYRCTVCKSNTGND